MPRHHTEKVAYLDERTHRVIQRSACQSRGVTRPLVLRDRVDEEPILVVIPTAAAKPHPVQSHDIGAVVIGQQVGVNISRRRRAAMDHREPTSVGIRHELADYTRNSWNPSVSSEIKDRAYTVRYNATTS